MTLIIVKRDARYQGSHLIVQYGRKCTVCGTEYWPDYPGCNRAYGPSRGYCCPAPSPEEEKKASIEVPFPTTRLEDLDF